MDAYERRVRIMELLERHGKVSINSLAQELGVSRVTARGDLDALEKRGLLVRTHGGAVYPENHGLARLVSRTIHEREAEKEAIAALAITLIQDGATVLIDAGSTTAILARRLRQRRLTVVTNSVPVLQELAGQSSIELLVSGGALRRPDMALIGQVSRAFYEQIRADVVFFGATAFSLDKGVSCANLIEAETKRHMIASGQTICLLADSAKAGKVALAHVCDWDEVDILITDRMEAEDREAMAKLGVRVMTP